MDSQDRDFQGAERSPYAIGYEWSVRITSISMEMAIPPLFGIWLDAKCGTLMVFTVLGAFFGMTTAMLHLIQLGKNHSNPTPKNNHHDKTSNDTVS